MPISEEYNNDIRNLLTEEAIEAFKSEIQKAKGNEIFCCGEADDERNVFEIKVLARGSDVAAPAILQNLKSGNVVIHNHPSGDLSPSEADVNIASFLGNQGIGFYIINNNVDDIYEVVAIPSQKERQYLDKDELLTILSKNGIVSKKHKGYEYRPNQLIVLIDYLDLTRQHLHNAQKSHPVRHLKHQRPNLNHRQWLVADNVMPHYAP